jgi:hypothetical protein
MVTRSLEHIYRNEKGEIYLSVTQQLQIAGLVDFSMVRPEDLEYAGLRGQYVHEAVHLYLYDDLDVESLDLAYKGYVKGFIKFSEEHSLLPISSEEIVYSDILRTAGAYDLVGWEMGNFGGAPVMIEIKSTATMPITASLQASAYLKFYNQDKCSSDYIENAYGLHLQNNGTYKLYKYKWRDDFRIFQKICHINWWALSNKIIPVGAHNNENVYNLCELIIKGN